MSFLSESNQLVIWIVEDDFGCQFVYEQILSPHYLLKQFDSLDQYIKEFRNSQQKPDVVIADLRLGSVNLDEYLFAHDWKKEWAVPLIVISSIDEITVLKKCFERGVDDFLIKPFKKNELIAKIEKFGKNQNKAKHSFKLDFPYRRLIAPSGLAIELTNREIQIVKVLFDHYELSVSKDVIVQNVWDSLKVEDKTFDVHLVSLRKKISPLGLRIVFKKAQGFSISVDCDDEGKRVSYEQTQKTH